MKKWTKGHARFIGRIIFADFLEYSLEKYKRFIEDTKSLPFFEKELIKIKRLSMAKIINETKSISSMVVAKITRSGGRSSELVEGRFPIRYSYEGFNSLYSIHRKKLDVPSKALANQGDKFFHRLRRINSRNQLTHRILMGIVVHQREYLSTGDPIDLVPLNQVELARWINRKNLPSEIDNSWVSRLVNGLSIITPSGEEKQLKWFFPTQRDINKRIVKQLLDRENEDIESGRLKKPLTDNQIRANLENKFELKLSRHSIGHCRKDMGIPSAKRRLSGYKYPPLSANFSVLYPLTVESVQSDVPQKAGIYEIRLKVKEIEYPNSKTCVIYIGSTRNIKKRLIEHLGKNSKNVHIKYFLKKFGCSFRYIQLSKGWKQEEISLYDLFKSTYGAPPKCNKVSP